MYINPPLKPSKELNEIFDQFLAAEAKFKCEAIKKGWKVLRNGWPDYLIYKDDQIAFVEVKDKGDWLKPNQIEMLSLLSKFGLKCFTWRPDKGFKRFKNVSRSA